jgi:hypothetical protein
MKPVVLSVVVLCAAALAHSPALHRDDDEARAAQASVLARKAVKEFTLRAGEFPLVLEREPVLQFANPVIGSVHGTVFIWTANGRPQAITSVFKWFAPAKHLGGRVPSGNRPRGSLADRGAPRRARPCPVELRARPNELSRSERISRRTGGVVGTPDRPRPGIKTVRPPRALHGVHLRTGRRRQSTGRRRAD